MGILKYKIKYYINIKLSCFFMVFIKLELLLIIYCFAENLLLLKRNIWISEICISFPIIGKLVFHLSISFIMKYSKYYLTMAKIIL